MKVGLAPMLWALAPCRMTDDMALVAVIIVESRPQWEDRPVTVYYPSGNVNI